jgi:simple sugar transport system substrate-binding protein
MHANMHIGQPEYDAGYTADERAKQDGIKTFVCVNHSVNSKASFQRCKGSFDAIGADYKSSVLDSGTAAVEVQSKTAAWLRNHPGTQAVLSLGPTSAAGAIRAVQQIGLGGKIWFALSTSLKTLLIGVPCQTRFAATGRGVWSA